jgi:hypothetical protein
VNGYGAFVLADRGVKKDRSWRRREGPQGCPDAPSQTAKSAGVQSTAAGELVTVIAALEHSSLTSKVNAPAACFRNFFGVFLKPVEFFKIFLTRKAHPFFTVYFRYQPPYLRVMAPEPSDPRRHFLGLGDAPLGLEVTVYAFSRSEGMRVSKIL